MPTLVFTTPILYHWSSTGQLHTYAFGPFGGDCQEAWQELSDDLITRIVCRYGGYEDTISVYKTGEIYHSIWTDGFGGERSEDREKIGALLIPRESPT